MNNGVSFYNASTLIAVIGILVALTSAVFGYQALRPQRREIIEGLRSKRSLIPPGTADVIEVRHNNVVLSDPQIVDYYLSCRGRYDVNTEDFDQKRPIIVEFQKQIVADLTRPPPGKPPAVKYVVKEGKLKVGPDLLAKRQSYVFTLLFDGDPDPQDVKHHLIDTLVTDGGARHKRYTSLTIYSYLTALICCLAGLNFHFGLIGSQANTTAGIVLVMAAFALAILGSVWALKPVE